MVGDTVQKGRRQIAILVTLALGLSLLGLSLQIPASANLPGSPFNAGDGDTIGLGSLERDWDSPAPNLRDKTDPAASATDDSLSAAEDDVNPRFTLGSIQSNKADITRIRVANERVTGITPTTQDTRTVKDFLYLAWNRPSDPNGNVDFDFELNKLAQPPLPTVDGQRWALNRSAGDLLLTFELLSGGTAPKISLRRWLVSGPSKDCDSNPSTPCWSKPQELTLLTRPAAEGAVDQIAGVGDITFGEMAVDLELAGVFTPGTCTSFASVYAKSRSAGSGFNSQISDLVAPTPTTVSNCGSITVSKAVDNPNPLDGDQTSFDFSVDCGAGVDFDLVAPGTQRPKTFSLAHAGSLEIENIPVGSSCTVTEAAPTRATHWTTTHTVNGGAFVSDRMATVSGVPVTPTQAVAFTNTRTTGALAVSKTSTGGVGAFTFDVDCGGTAFDRSNLPLTTVTAGTAVTSASITGIPTGTACTVTEDPNALYSTTVAPTNGQVTISAGTTQTVAFTNARKTATLTVDKLTTGGTGTFLFAVDCDGTTYDRTGNDKLSITTTGTAQVTGIPTGTSCTVTEDAHTDFTSSLRSPSSSATVVIDDNGETVYFQNVRKTGTLTVVKTSTGGTGNEVFTFEVDCTNNAFDRTRALGNALTITYSGSATVTGIPTGTSCTVTEVNDSRFSSTRTPSTGTVILDENGETVSFTNDRNMGTITVAKTTTGGTGTFTFNVVCNNATYNQTLTITNSNSATTTAIPTTTTCTVNEVSHPLFDSTRTSTAGSITVTSGTQTVSFTNVRKVGSLKVEKTTTGGAGTFTFVVDCDGTTYDRTGLNGTSKVTIVDSGSETIGNIPTGTACTVTEDAHALFNSSLTSASNTVTITDTAVRTVSFLNQRNTGSLTITKATTGGDGTFDFTVDCSDDRFDRRIAVATTGGSGTSSTIAGIPTTTSCTVTETVPAGWAVVGGAAKTATVNGSETVAFANRKLTSGIAVTKTPSATVVHLGDAVTYTYVVTNTGENALTSVTAVDDKCSPLTLVGGDADGNKALDIREVWTYTCTSTLNATTKNTVTATGVDPLGATPTASADATVNVIRPAIAIDKTPSASSVEPGTTVMYTFTVTNPGDVPLSAVAVTDDKCAPVTFVGGDTNVDELLQPGETWVFRCSQVQTGRVDTLTNIGTASGLDTLGVKVAATDTVNIVVVAPSVIVRAAPPAPASAPAPAPLAAPATLPRTGSDAKGLLQLAGSLILLGLALLVATPHIRRRDDEGGLARS